MKLIRALMNFILRVIFGVAALICIAEFLKNQGISTIVGVNELSLVTVGALGFSGIFLLYGIVLWQNL